MSNFKFKKIGNLKKEIIEKEKSIILNNKIYNSLYKYNISNIFEAILISLFFSVASTIVSLFIFAFLFNTKENPPNLLFFYGAFFIGFIVFSFSLFEFIKDLKKRKKGSKKIQNIEIENKKYKNIINKLNEEYKISLSKVDFKTYLKKQDIAFFQSLEEHESIMIEDYKELIKNDIKMQQYFYFKENKNEKENITIDNE